MNIPVLSVRQPWAWAIIHGGKDIENRNWSTRFRGRFFVHAANWPRGTVAQISGSHSSATTDLEHHCYQVADKLNLSACDLSSLICSVLEHRGGIIGSVELVDVVEKSDSPWFVGRYGFVLREPRILPFTPCKGSLGFFKCPSDVASALRLALCIPCPICGVPAGEPCVAGLGSQKLLILDEPHVVRSLAVEGRIETVKEPGL